MKKFGGYDAAKEAAKRQGSERLPVGAYVILFIDDSMYWWKQQY